MKRLITALFEKIDFLIFKFTEFIHQSLAFTKNDF